MIILFTLFFMAWKKYNYLPKRFYLNLEFKNRIQKIYITEPSLYDLLVFEEMIEEWQYMEALKFLKIDINKNDFLSNPLWIIKKILEICYWVHKSSNPDNDRGSGFFPSWLDILAHRYGVTPLTLLQELTPSILQSYIAGFDYNTNIESGKKGENYKYKEKQKISKNELLQAEEILKRVENFDFSKIIDVTKKD